MRCDSVQLLLPALIVIGISKKESTLALTSLSSHTSSSTFTGTSAHHNIKYNPSRRSVTSQPLQTTKRTMMFWSSWLTSWWGTPPTLDNTQQQQLQNQSMKRTSNQKYNTKGTTGSRKNLIKKVTFVRHGCTYMNEYLTGKDGGKRFAALDFTDVFYTPDQQQKYHDTPLSPLGQEQAKTLGSYPIPPTFTQNCDLVVVSPLTRALQTFDLGIKPYLPLSDNNCNNNPDSMTIPILALPYAAERLYLISDVGQIGRASCRERV